MSRTIYLVQQAFTSLRRNALVVAAAILAVFVSLTLAFGALVVNELFQATTARWQEGVAVVVFLNDDVGQPAQLDLQREIQAWDEVEETIFCDKTCAYLEFQDMFADQPALLEEVDPSVLPPSSYTLLRPRLAPPPPTLPPPSSLFGSPLCPCSILDVLSCSSTLVLLRFSLSAPLAPPPSS